MQQILELIQNDELLKDLYLSRRNDLYEDKIIITDEDQQTLICHVLSTMTNSYRAAIECNDMLAKLCKYIAFSRDVLNAEKNAAEEQLETIYETLCSIGAYKFILDLFPEVFEQMNTYGKCIELITKGRELQKIDIFPNIDIEILEKIRKEFEKE